MNDAWVCLNSIAYDHEISRQSRFSSGLWSRIYNNSMRENDVPVLARARQLQTFVRIKHQLPYGYSTRFQMIESVWMFKVTCLRLHDTRTSMCRNEVTVNQSGMLFIRHSACVLTWRNGILHHECRLRVAYWAWIEQTYKNEGISDRSA